MTSSMTLSQSISIAAQPASLSTLTKARQTESGDRTTLVQKILLSAAFFGTEMAVCSEQLFMTLSLQYLGVPVYLISVNGIFGGGASFLLLVLTGNFVDKGDNPKRRKLLVCIFSFGVILTSYTMLITASALKAHGIEDIGLRDKAAENTRLQNTSTTNLANTTSSTAYPFKHLESTNTGYNELSTSFLIDSHGIPASAVLGILSFSLIDVGFDVSSPVLRAYVLDNVPAETHSALLLISSITSATGGILLCVIGTLDLPNILEAAFGVEGVAAMLILISSVIMIAMTSGFICTVMTARYLNRLLKGSYVKIANLITAQNMLPNRRHCYEASNDDVQASSTHTDYDEKASLIRGKRNVSYPNDFDHESSIDFRAPYSYEPLSQSEGFANSTSFLTTSDHVQLDVIKEQMSHVDDGKISTQNDTHASNWNLFTGSELKRSAPLLKAISEKSRAKNMYDLRESNQSESVLNMTTSAAFTTSDRSFLSHLGSTTEQRSGFYDNKRRGSNSSYQRHDRKQLNSYSERSIDITAGGHSQRNISFCSKRLVLLCIVCFLSMSSVVSFLPYIANALTVGVYKGNPAGEVGSDEYFNYLKGQRSAPLGTLLVYIFFLIGTMSTKKVFHLIGELNFLMGCSAATVLSLATFIFLQTELSYYVSNMVFGLAKTCIFTVPFVLGNIYVKEEVMANAEEGSEVDGTTHVGRAMSIMGAIIPLAYFIYSTFMGPVMDAFDSAWVPMVYSCGASALSMLVLLFMYCI